MCHITSTSIPRCGCKVYDEPKFCDDFEQAYPLDWNYRSALAIARVRAGMETVIIKDNPTPYTDVFHDEKRYITVSEEEDKYPGLVCAHRELQDTPDKKKSCPFHDHVLKTLKKKAREREIETIVAERAEWWENTHLKRFLKAMKDGFQAAFLVEDESVYPAGHELAGMRRYTKKRFVVYLPLPKLSRG